MSHSFDQLAVPLTNGSILALPPVEEYAAAALRNASINGGILVDGEPLSTFRRQAGACAIAAAREYTLSLGLDPGPEENPSAPVIGSGHQPVTFHPGVMIKPVAMVRAARRMGAAPLFITVDSDDFRAEYVLLPSMDSGRLEKIEFPLFPIKKHCLYETAVAEPPEVMLDRFEAMAGFLAHPRLERPRRAMEGYLETLRKTRLDFPDYVSRAIVTRRAWMAPDVDGFPELPVSILSRQQPFLRFARHVMAGIVRFAAEYNRALDEYRLERKLRYPANPFPNLESGPGLIQAPFWVIESGERRKLFVRVDNGLGAALVMENRKELPMEAVLEGKVEIRPKAITLSLYLRLAVTGLFIHGVGGARYDHVTDAVMERYFGASPPESACLSATLWIDVPGEDPRQEIAEAERRIRDMEQHPEKAGAGRRGVERLASMKEELVGEIKNPGAGKKSLGIRIRELNQQMAALLSTERQTLVERLETLAPVELERQAAQARDYPFCLYSREALLALAGPDLQQARESM